MTDPNRPDRLEGPETQQLPAAASAPPAPPGVSDTQSLPAAALGGRWRLLLVPLLIGSLVAATLAAYGALNEGTGVGFNLAGFSSGPAAKSWLTTGAVSFALVQLGSALVMYGRVPNLTPPSWIGALHVWSGRAAFLLSVPVAIHCLYALGFLTYSPKVLFHSLFGVVFYGAFVTKLLGLRKDGLPGWALPLLGGLVFACLVGLWFTSAFGFFSRSGLTF